MFVYLLKRIGLALFAIIFFVHTLGAQSPTDSLPSRPKLRYILPASLMISGIALNGTQLEKDLQVDVRNMVGNEFSTPLDDYTRLVPIGLLVGANIAGAPGKNHWFDQGKNFLISVVVTDFLTFRLKRWVGKTRPDETDDKSFPSGHTSGAFAYASVLRHEYGETQPWMAYTGYAFAVATGALRVANNRHWTSDVLMGAGMAMLVTELVYYFDPIIRWNPYKEDVQAVILPDIGGEHYGLQLMMSF